MNQPVQSFISSTTSPPVASGDGRIAFISAGWHRDIVLKARDAFLDELGRQGVSKSRVEQFEVPGAFEIPLLAKKLAQSGRYVVVVACGFVIDGGIYRHEFVASAVIDGLMRVQLETGIPVLSAILTPHAFHDHADHQRFFGEHFVTKGTEVARACLETIAAHAVIERLAAT